MHLPFVYPWFILKSNASTRSCLGLLIQRSYCCHSTCTLELASENVTAFLWDEKKRAASSNWSWWLQFFSILSLSLQPACLPHSRNYLSVTWSEKISLMFTHVCHLKNGASPDEVYIVRNKKSQKLAQQRAWVFQSYSRYKKTNITLWGTSKFKARFVHKVSYCVADRRIGHQMSGQSWNLVNTEACNV